MEEAIIRARAALEIYPQGHDRSRPFIILGNALRRRFLKLGKNADLEEAISLNQSTLNLCPEGHPYRSDSLHSLALCFSNRYDKQGSIADLEEAITLGRAALELRSPSHCHRAATLYSLAEDLRRRFMAQGANADLDEAISLHRSALDLRPVGHPCRLSSLDQLVSCLGLRFTKSEALADLDKCIMLRRAALELRKPEDPDHVTCFRHLVADFQSMLRKLESPSDIPDSSDHTTLLHDLVICIGDVVREGHTPTTDVDEIVAVARTALMLCPSGHPERIVSLTTLTTCLQHRFQHRGVITDLDDAIALFKELLERYPSDSNSAALLHKLAWCLSQRFTELSTGLDLDDAIKFEQTASTLYSPGHPGYAESLNSLTTYRQLRVKWRSTGHLSTGGEIEQVILAFVFELLKAHPPRLLDTYSGMLCNRDQQFGFFKSSEEYKQLVLSTSALATSSVSNLVRTVVSTYFQYVTLSHRWGNSEPLLRDIEGRVLYDLGSSHGLSKLQSFCLASLERGYSWAWSDTCCIDKESSAELQEAIGSIFSWHRQSALTMVYLADVSETDTLSRSEWFRRGWTLQELLAPRSLLFFTRDWSLYQGISSNHKENGIILSQLEQATGIMSRHLTNFHPTVDDARLRLQWASTRYTTRPEDISYSLFGIFGLHLPVLYGEPAGNALGRLLAEVISKSGDTSILDWVGQSSGFHSCLPATIAPYQTLPSQHPLPDPATPLNLGWLWFPTLKSRAVRKMHRALSRLPLTQFINFRLILPCIVHHINTIRLTRVDTAVHVHRIEVIGLEPIEITLSQPLENTSGTEVVTYILIRPWHSSFLDTSVMTDNASARRWLMRMRRPFDALLLQELPQNECKRVASSCHILARPTNSAGVLKGEVTTLTIV